MGVGGSEAGVVAGLSTWEQPYGLWTRKITDQALSIEELEAREQDDEKEYQLWGKLLEDPIAAEFSKRTGIEVHKFNRMVRNTEYPFMFANVDRLTGPANELDGVLEIKTTRFADQWADGAVPLTYGVQGQHYLAVLGLPRVHYACLIGGQALVITTVERDDQLIADLAAIEEAFWQQVLKREAPPADGSESTRKALQRRWRPDPDKVIALDPEYAEIIKRRHDITEAIKDAKAEVDGIDALLMEDLGDAEVGTINGQKVVTWKGSTRNSLDTKALKEAHPALAAEFMKATEVRTLRYSTTKEES
jgi:putative phage-type endonuclease